MNTTSTLPARAAVVAAIAAVGLTAACGSAEGTAPDRDVPRTAQDAAADDVVTHVEHRKAATQDMERRQHSAADDIENWVEQRKSMRFRASLGSGIAR